MSEEFIPHKYQEPIIELMAHNDIFGIFAFPGSGKTVISLDKIYKHKDVTLIVVPLDILYTTWMTEHKKWSFSKKLRIQLLHGKYKDRNFMRKGGIYLINPEGIKWLLEKVQKTKRFPWTNIIIDESVKFKNHKSGRFKDLIKLIKTFKRRYILCGNPMPNHFLDIWAQVFLLDQGKRLGKSWYGFRNKYFYPTDYMRYNWELKPGAQELIIEKISDIVYFLETSEEIPLPSRIIVDVKIPLPLQARKHYNLMQDKLFAQLDDGENVVADNRTSALMKCWQIANGFLYETYDKVDENGIPILNEKEEVIKLRRTHRIHNELAIHAKTLVDSLQGQPILIAYHFKEDLERLKEMFPDARVVATGAKPSELKSAERDWNNNKIEVLIVYVSKFSHGLNLQYGKGHHLLFYCLTYNFDTYDQLIRRFERQGAKFKEVVIHRFIVENTIHEAIVEKIEHKADESYSFLLALNEYRKKYL